MVKKMSNINISVDEFRTLQKRVEILFSLHDLDSKLNSEEKKSVEEVKKDIKENKTTNFVSVDEL
jgi:hypothetical protein